MKRLLEAQPEVEEAHMKQYRGQKRLLVKAAVFEFSLVSVSVYVSLEVRAELLGWFGC